MHRETRWVTGITRYEFNGSCSVGLGQINVACDSPDLVPLLDARANLRHMGVFLARLRSTCQNDCQNLGWLRAYNPGSAEYFTAVRDAVRTFHAQNGQLAVLPVPHGVHASRVPRKARGRAGHERRLDPWDDNSGRHELP